MHRLPANRLNPRAAPAPFTHTHASTAGGRAPRLFSRVQRARPLAAACAVLLGACTAWATGETALNSIVGRNGYVVETYYDNPHADETLVSFDWDASTNLYYSTGRPNWALGLSFYRYNGTAITRLYTNDNVFAGSRVTTIGQRVYFNDGGDYGRWTFDYFKFTPADGGTPVRVIDSTATSTDIWGLQARNGGELWAAGGWSSAIYRTALDGAGDPLTLPPTALGVIGESSGPLAFDAAGNAYYANAYVSEGEPMIYRWSAAEVNAAIANPSCSPLSPADHEWATISGGFSGSTGMACDEAGNVIVTATAFGMPSEVRLYRADTAGRCRGMTVIATTANRAETVRVRDGVIYVSDAEGIAAITYPLAPAPGVLVDTVYDNPHAGETLVSFDWDASTNLYYSTGRPNYGLGLSVYRYTGTAITRLYTNDNVFAGSRVTAIGQRVYFNDGGDYGRWTSDYFKFTPADGRTPVRVIDSAATGTDIWGLQARNGGELWAAGGWSSAIYRTALDGAGDPLTLPPTALGVIGESSGPLAFDAAGNVYYANAYVSEGEPKIYRWPAAEVAAAIADPVGNPLSPAGHEWAVISGGLTGATGMAIDGKGHVVLTATAFGMPGEVRRYFARPDGGNAGWERLVTSPDRPETVRCAHGRITFSTAKGIFSVKPAARGTVIMLY